MSQAMMLNESKDCPYCAETIKAAAIKCRFCGSDLQTPSPSFASPVVESPEPLAVAAPYVPRSHESIHGVQEAAYLNNQDVTITGTRAILRGKTYAMANITSVSMFEEKPDTSKPVMGLIGGALCAWFAGSYETWGAMLLCMAIAGLCLWAILAAKSKFWVRIGSASSEANAFWSHDKNYAREVVEAMNKAIALRG